MDPILGQKTHLKNLKEQKLYIFYSQTAMVLPWKSIMEAQLENPQVRGG